MFSGIQAQRCNKKSCNYYISPYQDRTCPSSPWPMPASARFTHLVGTLIHVILTRVSGKPSFGSLIRRDRSQLWLDTYSTDLCTKMLFYAKTQYFMMPLATYSTQSICYCSICISSYGAIEKTYLTIHDHLYVIYKMVHLSFRHSIF